jgi:acyl-coenzyme A synthetase/AMP-(fatty) acid ligase
MDWHMMQLGSLERTEKQWRALAESCGLEVKDIWWETESVGRRGLIECVKKA